MTARIVPEPDLPTALTAAASVEAAYPESLARCHEALRRGLSVLVECDRELAPVFAQVLRARLEDDGRPVVACETAQALAEALRQPAEPRVLFLPHLDLLTTPDGALAPEARELVPRLYESPESPWVGFTDPASSLPRAAADLFARRETLIGVPRARLSRLVTRDEARRLGGLDPLDLGMRVSGVNAVRLRRLLAALDDADDARAVLRDATLGGLTVPAVDLERDVGGYPEIKERIRRDLLDVWARRGTAADLEAAARVEALLPRGVIFWGPTGTGKTTFARAIASALRAALAVLSGPELKARWTAGGEEELRRTFVRAREAAPSVVLVEGLDAFSPRREAGADTPLAPSMQHALLAEIDALGPEEHVLVVATTNGVDAVEPALLRPGRFELDLYVGLPTAGDRRAILEVLSERLDLGLEGVALDYAVERSGDPVLAGGAAMSGDHLQALARGLARSRLRDGASGPTTSAEVEQVITEIVGRPSLDAEETELTAVHEAGHALVALILGQRVDRLTIAGDLGGAASSAAAAQIRRGTASQAALTDALCILMGGREAEEELLGELSGLGARDLTRASSLARTMCAELGMGPALFPSGSGESIRAGIDFAVRDMLKTEQERARQLLEEQRGALIALSRALQEREVLDGAVLAALVKVDAPPSDAAAPAAGEAGAEGQGAGAEGQSAGEAQGEQGE